MIKNNQSEQSQTQRDNFRYEIGTKSFKPSDPNIMVQQTFVNEQIRNSKKSQHQWSRQSNTSQIMSPTSFKRRRQREQKLKFNEQDYIESQRNQIKQTLLSQARIKQDDNKDLEQQVDQKLQQIRTIAYKSARATKVDAMFVGIWIGISISLLILLIVVITVNNVSIKNDTRFSRDFPTWRGVAIFIFYIWILAFNIWMFQKYKINYRKIFGFNQDHFPHAVNIFKIAGLQTTCFLVLFCFYIFAYTEIFVLSIIDQQYFALISWVFFVFCLFMPIPYFSNKGRFFALKLLLKSILSPFIGVTFPIAWMTDQLVSMAIPLKDFEYTICYYTQLSNIAQDYTYCQDTHRVSAVVVVAVAVCTYRVFQCIRQGYDKREYFMTAFFFNTLKYLVTIVAAILAFEYKIGDQSFLSAWLLFAVISTIYSYSWDIKMDWGLLQKNPKHPLLRKKIIFGSKYNYYIICIGNLIMRWVWILTFSPVISNFFGNVNLFYLATGMIEIFRRGIWNLLRFQKQHLHHQGEHKIEQSVKQKQKSDKLHRSYSKLQIKLLRFYDKFKVNLQLSQKQLEQIKLEDQKVKQVLKKRTSSGFQQQELRQISRLMSEVLQLDPKLKKKMARDQKKDKKLKQKKDKQQKNKIRQQ